jgi:hypothetical protein
LAVTPGTTYTVVVGNRSINSLISPARPGAVKIAYWQPVP